MKQQTYVMRVAQTGANGCGVNTEIAHTIDTAAPEAVAQPIAMASGQANAEICEGGGRADSDGAARGPVTSNGADVFPSLCATDGSKQFIDNQSVSGGRLLLDPRQGWV